jgi:ABC-2 type transport system permease protein
MTASTYRARAVAVRVGTQLIRDRRFLILSLAAPLLVVYLLNVFFESATTPLFSPTVFVVPVGAFIVHFITYILCAIVLVRERTAQTLSRMFVNGYQQSEIIGGYVMAYTTLATVQSLLVLTEIQLLFDLGYSIGTWFLIYLVIWLLAIISIALGIFLSNFARNEGQVFPFIPLVIFPSVFVSGLIVPVGNMPGWAQVLSRITPLYYANQTIQDLIKPNASLSDGLDTFLLLPVYAIVVLVLATLTLRELD